MLCLPTSTRADLFLLSQESSLLILAPISFFFFFNDTATTEIYTLSLHDALPISHKTTYTTHPGYEWRQSIARWTGRDRKSTRLNSSHSQISYAVFCLKKKKNHYQQMTADRQLLSPEIICLAGRVMCLVHISCCQH